MTIHKNVVVNWDNTGDRAEDVVFYREVRELERENARMRRALEVLRDRRDWISATDVDALIRNALSA